MSGRVRVIPLSLIPRRAQLSPLHRAAIPHPLSANPSRRIELHPSPFPFPILIAVETLAAIDAAIDAALSSAAWEELHATAAAWRSAHPRGEFVIVGQRLEYQGGQEAMSYIERDKVSLPEIMGHLRDHCSVAEGSLLHWLFSGKELHNGLRVLVDDKVCLYMSEYIVEGGVADIYVEEGTPTGDSAEEDSKMANVSDFEDELVDMDVVDADQSASEEEQGAVAVVVQPPPRRESREEIERQIKQLQAFYNSPSKFSKQIRSRIEASSSKVVEETVHPDADSSSDSDEDNDYFPGDEHGSEEDEEAEVIKNKFKEFKKKLKKGECATLDDIVLEGSTKATSYVELEGGGDDIAYEQTDEDELVEDIGSDEEKIYRRYNSENPTASFEIGMKFTCKKEFKEAIVRYCLSERKVIKYLKDDDLRIATLVDEHTCPSRRDNKHVTAQRIAEKYEKFILSNPNWNFLHMKNTVQEEMFVDVSLSKLKRAKAIVLKKALDSRKGQYERLYDYKLELLRSNPVSTVVINKEDNCDPPVFRRMYICLQACKQGFMAGCRKVIGLDGCFFKGATSGELLCALGRDSNNQMYPVAWAVNNDNWSWFCDLLSRDIKIEGGKDRVIISDQQKINTGIINAVQLWAPEAEHRNCARHIYANWKKEFNDKEWQKLFWGCAKAPNTVLFNHARAKLAQKTRAGAQAILKTHPQHWLGSNCDSVDNNICESFNKWIARFYPIISMLEAIRIKVIVRIQEQRAKAEKWMETICPNISKKLHVYIKQSVSNGAKKFEVKHWDHRFTIDLAKKECSCRYWQLSGLPCPHAVSSICFKTNSLDNYVADCYKVDRFNKIYSHCLEPVEGMQSWPVLDRPKLKAPGYIKMPGRPKTERRRESQEKPKAKKMSRMGIRIRCTTCKGIGHNRASCDKRTAGGSSQNPSANNQGSQGTQQENQSAGHSQIAIVPQTLAESNVRKRHHSLTLTTASQASSVANSSQQKATKKTTTKVPKSKAMGRAASMNLQAKGSVSHATSSVSVNITSGKATAKAVLPHGITQIHKETTNKRRFHLILKPTNESAPTAL
ncbi:LOW QUALITY PROTEIN: hypothetical protein U9M48_033767 [Paspalum notatum var. saurae]|uniref:SWIM-type domain-containing protein n=1 Tax=Paspalum notatum var. saurae TaxID=547442 RepID=A0AAQ3U868_PASNO